MKTFNLCQVKFWINFLTMGKPQDYALIDWKMPTLQQIITPKNAKILKFYVEVPKKSTNCVSLKALSAQLIHLRIASIDPAATSQNHNLSSSDSTTYITRAHPTRASFLNCEWLKERGYVKTIKNKIFKKITQNIN